MHARFTLRASCNCSFAWSKTRQACYIVMCVQVPDEFYWTYYERLTATQCAEYNGTKGFKGTGDE